MRMSVTIAATPKLPSSKRVAVLMRQAVNRAAAGARTEITRAVRAEVPTILARRVRQDVQVVKGSGPVALVRVAEHPMSLRDVIRAVRPTRGTPGRPGGIKGSLGRRIEIPEAFVGPGGHLYMRRGKSRLPIRRLSAPSVRDLAISVWDTTRPKVASRLDAEVRRVLQRVGFKQV